MDILQFFGEIHGPFYLHGHLVVHEFRIIFSLTFMDGEEIQLATGLHGRAFSVHGNTLRKLLLKTSTFFHHHVALASLFVICNEIGQSFLLSRFWLAVHGKLVFLKYGPWLSYKFWYLVTSSTNSCCVRLLSRQDADLAASLLTRDAARRICVWHVVGTFGDWREE